MRRIFKRILFRLLPRSDRLYRISRRYVDIINGENDGDMEFNGEMLLMRRLLPHAKVVFDVGANVGDWTARALAINAGLLIHCFEPSARTYDLLIRRTYRSQDIVFNRFGLSSTAGEAPLFIFSEGSGINTLHARSGLQGYGLRAPQEVETVQLRTLDDYCRERGVEHVDFLKLDVEGHELEVIKGASRLMSAGGVDVVQFEYGGCNVDARVFLKDLFDCFSGYGFTLYKLTPDDIQRFDQYDQRLDNFQYQNWVAIRSRSGIDPQRQASASRS